jgi:2-amino-4-hydroxy-6-hydroxymethyldihydropteridine diphosphokinase
MASGMTNSLPFQDHCDGDGQLTERVEVAIALGSNLGDPVATLQAACQCLDRLPDTRLLRTSSLYRTAPVGPPQPDYVNACAILRTRLTAEGLLHHLLAIETQFGRERRERWGPRTLDLDLLLYGDAIIASDSLTVPHPRLQERAFVLVPLAEVAAAWMVPGLNQSIIELLHALDQKEIFRLDFSKSALPSLSWDGTYLMVDMPPASVE